ncbi:hypothetical protein [Cryobacterium sp. CG_9.6]|nr:hypothetical protein [Cryobacterium sp. CG_9.6]MDH6235608.1 hypothetical protein [Cryobacterium sp. CG_9.6]
MFQYNAFVTVSLIAALAAVVVLFWLAITAIRALNVYIAKNRSPRAEKE